VVDINPFFARFLPAPSLFLPAFCPHLFFARFLPAAPAKKEHSQKNPGRLLFARGQKKTIVHADPPLTKAPDSLTACHGAKWVSSASKGIKHKTKC